MLAWLSVLVGCSQIWPRAAPLPPPEPGPPYADRVAHIEAVRHTLATSGDVELAEPALRGAIVDLIEAWYGTPWDFYGTAAVPGDDPIACGHFVAGVLSDAGLEVERRRLGQQAAEHIIQTVTSEASIRRYRSEPVRTIVADVQQSGPGIYIVGLDHHVGFLVHHDDGVVGFCHSTYLEGLGVVCE
ncbi:MAG: hypothetical protein KTR31_32245, partial [Myxococcales bacterium]|nr:hypothetical protein [Myxococcales bacterium]